jgi:hypothetical protein
LTPCLTKHHAVKRYGGIEVQLHHALTSALDGGEWSASRPGRFTTGDRTPSTHWIEVWVGLRAGLDAVVKRRIPRSCRVSNSDRPARSPVTIPTELSRLQSLQTDLTHTYVTRSPEPRLWDQLTPLYGEVGVRQEKLSEVRPLPQKQLKDQLKDDRTGFISLKSI